MTRYLLVSIVGCLAIMFPLQAAPHAEALIIISMDGGKPSVIQTTQMPNLKAKQAAGSYAWNAKTVFPSVTLVSHTSMLTGLSPLHHQVLWNEWQPEKGLVKVPTIFALAKERGISTAMFVGKDKFRHLNLTNSLDNFSVINGGAIEIVNAGVDYLRKKKPQLTFLHFRDPDESGHEFGWGSMQQVEAFQNVDRALKVLIDFLQQSGLSEETVVMVTADHGGHDKTHGSNSSEDMTIPWIVWGKGVRKNHLLTTSITTYDTAATALWLMDVPPPSSFDGKPVIEAFE